MTDREQPSMEFVQWADELCGAEGCSAEGRLKDDVDGTYQTISLQWCVTLDGCGTYMAKRSADKPYINADAKTCPAIVQIWCQREQLRG
uniref:Uncharacterized protein n=1 Tax=Oryza glumipatula TaxID=40148 RepID=A0A0D9ZJ17_9ORYZ